MGVNVCHLKVGNDMIQFYSHPHKYALLSDGEA